MIILKKHSLTILGVIRLGFYLFLFITFIIIPTSFFIDNDIYGFDKAFSPTGGVTRAFSSIMHGKFIDAFIFNPVFTCAIAPICIIIFIQDIYIIIYRLIKKDKKYSIIEAFFIWK